MWLLIQCDDPIHGPGHNEKRRILLPGNTEITIDRMFRPDRNHAILPGTVIEVHPHTPRDEGYHCPICHKDIKPILQK